MFSLEWVFYLVCASQIYLLSIHYPNKLSKRVAYILAHYPATDYPRLYPKTDHIDTETQIKKHIKIFLSANRTVALIGLFVIGFAYYHDFKLAEKGGAELFVVIYLFLQFIPHGLFEIMQAKYYKNIRKAQSSNQRSASLTRRTLANFINPKWVIFAVLLYILHLILFIYYQGDETWDDGVYITLIVGTLLNGAFAYLIFHYVKSWKLDPYQSEHDKFTVIRANIRVLVMTSIMMSLFFIVINSVREFGLDRYEPILMSLYFHFLIIFGMGRMMREIKVEDVDFEGYKA